MSSSAPRRGFTVTCTTVPGMPTAYCWLMTGNGADAYSLSTDNGGPSYLLNAAEGGVGVSVEVNDLGPGKAKARELVATALAHL
jgi:hypothetical protein